MLAKGAGFLRRCLEAAASVTVTVRRSPSAFTAGVPAAIGRSEFDQIDLGGGVLLDETRTVDFLIPASEYKVGLPGPVEPARGDEIDVTYDSATTTYLVTSPGGHRPAWRWSDTSREVLRVHTVEV